MQGHDKSFPQRWHLMSYGSSSSYKEVMKLIDEVLFLAIAIYSYIKIEMLHSFHRTKKFKKFANKLLIDYSTS